MGFPGTGNNAPEKLRVPWVGHSPSVPFLGPRPGADFQWPVRVLQLVKDRDCGMGQWGWRCTG